MAFHEHAGLVERRIDACANAEYLGFTSANELYVNGNSRISGINYDNLRKREASWICQQSYRNACRTGVHLDDVELYDVWRLY